MNNIKQAIKSFRDIGGNVIVDTHGVRASVLFTDISMPDDLKDQFPILKGGRVIHAFLDTDIGGWLVGDLPADAILV